MAEVTVTVGHAPIPFSGLGSYGRARDPRSTFGRAAFGFAASAATQDLVRQALARLRVAIDAANEQCADARGGLQSVFNWVTGSTFDATICDRAASMQSAYDFHSEKLADPNTTEEQLADVLANVNAWTDIRDLIELNQASDAARILAAAAAKAPGTVVGWSAGAAEKVGGGILGAIPWWGWAIGALFLANQLGWKPLEWKPLKRR